MTDRPPVRTGPDVDPYAEIDVSQDPGRPDYTIEGAPGAILAIISGPSGVGKDTIIDMMRRREAENGRSGERHYVVTVTTREPREGEIDGVDYHFVTREEFLAVKGVGVFKCEEFGARFMDAMPPPDGAGRRESHR